MRAKRLRRRDARTVLAGAIIAIPFVWVYPVTVAKAEVPAVFSRPERLIGVHVVQKRGWVRDAEDHGDVIRKGYWTLDDVSAVGTVQAFHADGTVDVAFADETGWSRVDFTVTKVSRTAVTYDKYGDRLNLVSWTEEGVKIDPRDHGVIIAEDGNRRIVRFPLNCLALAPLKVGDRVVRGPDWNRGFSDGGDFPQGDNGSVGDLWGEVIKEADADHYVKVKWSKTGIRESCRFDCRRKYDIVPNALRGAE
jgi:hypothetical protein